MSVAVFSSSRSLPKPLSRDKILNIRTSFQGLTVQTSGYGSLLAWGPEISSLSASDRLSYYAAKRAAGDTHLEIAISWAYNNDNGFSYPVPGTDLTQKLQVLRARIVEAITIGGFRGILLKLAGDGEGAGPGYNNPDGMSYGRQWLMDNFQRIYDALKDLSPYIIWIPGYDDIWYGWASPDEFEAWLLFARSVIGNNGYLGIEFSVGIIFWRSGASDYTSPAGQCIDVVPMEFDADLHQDSFWQISARLLGPAYVRPSDQPANDDTNPPYYLTMTPRGPQIAVFYEHMTYQWVRGQCSLSDVNNNRAYAAAAGWKAIC